MFASFRTFKNPKRGESHKKARASYFSSRDQSIAVPQVQQGQQTTDLCYWLAKKAYNGNCSKQKQKIITVSNTLLSNTGMKMSLFIY